MNIGQSDNEKYFKDDEAWEKAEKLLRGVLNKRKEDFEEALGEAAFYGPKIDIQMKNANGKEDTAFTVQYDFYMPKKFGLKYIDKDGKEKEPVVVHRSSIGAIERIIAFLIEFYAGAFPLWLSPVQVKILPIADSHNDFAKEVGKKLFEKGFRIEVDDNSDTLGKKISRVKKEKIPYYMVIGDKEKDSGTLKIEGRDGKARELSLDVLMEELQKEIDSKS